MTSPLHAAAIIMLAQACFLKHLVTPLPSPPQLESKVPGRMPRPGMDSLRRRLFALWCFVSRLRKHVRHSCSCPPPPALHQLASLPDTPAAASGAAPVFTSEGWGGGLWKQCHWGPPGPGALQCRTVGERYLCQFSFQAPSWKRAMVLQVSKTFPQPGPYHCLTPA